MKNHTLKIHQQPYDDLVSGAKTSEVRRCDDRDFQVGDYVELYVVDEQGVELRPAKLLTRAITHIQKGYGLPDGLCVLSYGVSAVLPNASNCVLQNDSLAYCGHNGRCRV